VLATAETWRAIGRYAIPERVTLEPRVPVAVGSLSFVAFPVDHSLRAPAVGYRLEAGTVAVFYAPDVVAIHDRAAALGGIRCYLGDGASVTRGIVRRRNGTPIGHASIRTQLDWCAEEGVGRAIFTHCGSQILRDEARGRPRSRHSRKTVASPRVSRTTT
jgi:hypothetical protein